MSQLVCPECHDRCERVLRLRIGRAHETRGARIAKTEKRDPNYYDGLIDGLNEAIAALGPGETGLYWSWLRRELK